MKDLMENGKRNSKLLIVGLKQTYIKLAPIIIHWLKTLWNESRFNISITETENHNFTIRKNVSVDKRLRDKEIMKTGISDVDFVINRK